jgi:hypothetical protein
MNKRIYAGVTIAAVATLLAAGSLVVNRRAHAAGIMAPHFEVDPYWPRPLPNHWIIGQTIGLDVDSTDNVWIIHRPATFDTNGRETYAMTNSAICCVAAPDVLEFNAAGDLIGHWGRAEGHDWPSSNHGITVDSKGNVWLGANGTAQSARPPGAAPSPAGRGRAGANGPEEGVASGGAAPNQYHDAFILKFTQDGKFLGEIGGANKSKGSNDTESVRGVAEIRFNKEGELIAADGYGNKRVSIWDPETMKLKRYWGAYGKKPDDTDLGPYDPSAPVAQQFRNPVHCAVPSSDGLIYVCDRVNDRIQIFKEDGTFVKEVFLMKNTKGDGSAWEIAFSKDKDQKFMYVADGANEQVHIFDRASMNELTAFGDGGRQPGQFYAVHSIATNSKGDIFTTETYRGQRVQKFIYRGLAAVSGPNSGVPWTTKR